MRKKLLHSTGIIAIGTAIGQGVILLSTPFLSRIYSPAEFGTLAMLLTISNISTAASCLRFDLAIPSASNQEATSILSLSTLSALISGLIAFIILSVLSVFPEYNSISSINSPILISTCITLVGLMQTGLNWASRLQGYKQIASARAIQGLGFSGLALFSPIGLLWAHTLSFLAALFTIKQQRTTQEIESSNLVKTLNNNWQFLFLSLPGALLDVIGYSICIWVITTQYGSINSGEYSQIQRILGAPLMLLGVSIAPVLMRHSADHINNKKELKNLFFFTLKILSAIGTITITITITIGEPMLGWLLGENWRVDTAFISSVAIAVIARACVSPLSTLLISLKRFDLSLKWQVLYLASSTSILITSSNVLGFTDFITLYAAHELILYGIYLTLIHKSIR
jgi:teichuronic acid exporter